MTWFNQLKKWASDFLNRGRESAYPEEPFDESNSDGCTLVPDFDFKECCVTHDKSYYYGGSAGQRKHADLRFRRCIKKKGHPFLAWLYFTGVRLLGVPVWPSRARWGKGFRYNKSNFYSNQSTNQKDRDSIS